MPTVLPLNILLPQAAANPQIRAQAANLAATRAADLVRGLGEEHTRTTVRVSDAGRCARELYAHLHDEFDLPDDGTGILTRLDMGTLYGFWIAALEAAVIEEYWRGVRETSQHGGPRPEFAFEADVAYAGVVPGHIDLGVSLDGVPWWLIENKSTYGAMPISPPHVKAPSQVLQAGTYAHSGGYPAFSIITIGPSVQAKWDKELKQRIEFPKIVQSDYVTEQVAPHVSREMNRLVSIQDADQPPAEDILATWRPRDGNGKVIEAWRCRYCRVSKCPRNQNALRFLVDE